MRFVLDTTAFLAAMRRDSALLKLLKKYQPGEIVTVPPVVAEIQYGLERLDKPYVSFGVPRGFPSAKLRIVNTPEEHKPVLPA